MSPRLKRYGACGWGSHSLLVGGNNIGKSTICEAVELVLGPQRLGRRPLIDEHDFFQGRYLDASGEPIEICIEAILADLSPGAENASSDVMFFGRYHRDEDDFLGQTFFDHPKRTLDPENDEAEAGLGGGRQAFSRENTRLSQHSESSPA